MKRICRAYIVTWGQGLIRQRRRFNNAGGEKSARRPKGSLAMASARRPKCWHGPGAHHVAYGFKRHGTARENNISVIFEKRARFLPPTLIEIARGGSCRRILAAASYPHQTSFSWYASALVVARGEVK